jgi:transcriptional regulator with XRE-family HTH domain
MPSVSHPKRPLQRHFLKEWREFRNLSQEEAASRLGISRTQLSKIENRKSPYGQQFMEAAADAYGCTVADLVTRNPGNIDAVWSITDHLRTASAEQKAQVLRIVDALLKTGS